MKLSRQQCVLHPDRGAVARCPVCKRYYCHECITEHDGQVLCCHCLLQQVQDADNISSFMDRHAASFQLVAKPLLALGGLLLLWLIFAVIGTMLMRFPNNFYLSVSDSSEEASVEIND